VSTFKALARNIYCISTNKVTNMHTAKRLIEDIVTITAAYTRQKLAKQDKIKRSNHTLSSYEYGL